MNTFRNMLASDTAEPLASTIADHGYIDADTGAFTPYGPDQDEAPEYAPEVLAEPFPVLNLAELATRRAEAKRYAIERIAPEGEVTTLNGPGSAGKSLLGQQLATAAAAGMPCLGLAVQPGPAIYLTCEDDAAQLHWRQQHLCAAMGVDMASLAGKLHLASLRGELGNELATFGLDGRMSVTASFHRLAATLEATGAKLIILDNVGHLFTGNENDRGEVTRFVNLLNRLAGTTGAAIILIGHPNKAGDEWSGSTAWNNAVRSRLWLEHDETSDLRTLSLPKANYSRKGEIVSFRWHDWAFVRDEDLPADTRTELAEVIRANGENNRFLECLAAATASRRNVSHIHGTNYAPKIFAGMPEAKGMKVKAFAGAMERLIHLGKIELDAELWRDAHRKVKTGIRVAEKCGDPPAATPCGDLRRPLPETGENPCGDPRAATPPYINISGAALGSAAPDFEDDDRNPFDPAQWEGR